MKKAVMTTILVLVVVLVTGCGEALSLVSTPAVEEVNFRLLISDEVNAIDHFVSVNVTISSIGLQQRGEPGKWITHELDPKKTENLKDLVGENATEIWSGYVDPGEYTKVFIHVDNVTGILDSAYGGGTANVTLPSNKLQISKPFTLNPDLLVNFVFDITVVEAGKSSKYILKPQIDPSGPNKPFNDVTLKGKPENTGKPEGKGKPEGQEADEDATPPVISISGVTNDEQYKAPVTPTFEVSDETDPEPTVTATLNEDTFVSGTEVSEVGEYELVVTAVDASGNEAESSINFEIVEVGDTTAPVIDVSGVSNGEQYTEPVIPIVDVSDDTDPNPTVTITLNGVEFASGTEISEAGEYELVVTAIDASENEAEVIIEFEIVREE